MEIKWAYYALKTLDINGLDTGSAIPSTTREAFYSLSALVPPLAEQRAIAGVLGALDDRIAAKPGDNVGMRRLFTHLLDKLVGGEWTVAEGEAWLAQLQPLVEALDDKIELNRQMNRTLEGIARALFRAWFVDFAPVRAKARGETPPDLPPAIAAIFPDRLVDSPLGEIPAGWEVMSVDRLAERTLGGDWGTDQKTPDHSVRTRCARGADIPALQAGGLGDLPIRYLKPSSLQKRALVEGELVIEVSGGSPTQSTGRPVLVTQQLLDRLDAPLVCSNFCRILTPTDPQTGYWLYMLLRQLYDNDEFFQYENGTTGIKNFAMGRFLETFKCAVPPKGVMGEYVRYSQNLFLRMSMNDEEACTLAALRDALLPRLISGELRVGEFAAASAD